MAIKECILRVCSEYLVASSESFGQHELANFIRKEFRDSVASVVGTNDRLEVKGSAGQGTWARGPWVGIFDKSVTSGAQSGFYPVYLFREDMSCVYLSLNQGMTEAKKIYKSDAKTALSARAKNYRAMLGDHADIFTEKCIDLSPSSKTNDTAFYEAGNICAKYYSAGQLPEEKSIIEDLHLMLALYNLLVSGATGAEAMSNQEGDEPGEISFEDATKFRMHKRIERNLNLVKKVKARLGFTCQVCQINFESIYGEIGKNFIEAHHLRPLASLEGRVAMNPDTDFAVLCANCHRMIHRAGCVDNIAQFKAHHCGV